MRQSTAVTTLVLLLVLCASSAGENWANLRVNGVHIGDVGHAMLPGYSVPLVATLNLKKADKVDMWLVNGAILDNGDHQTNYSGFLLEEDLVSLFNR